MTYTSEYFVVDLSEAKTYLGIDDADQDDVLGFLMQAVTELFETNTGRVIAARDITEVYDGNGSDSLYLNTYPVNSTNETIDVRLDGNYDFDAQTQIPAASLFVDGEMGRVLYVGGRFWRKYGVQVTYNGGYTTIPHDLKMAALHMLSHLYQVRNESHEGMTAYSRGDVSLTYAEDLPPMVGRVLQRYRRYG